VLKRSITLDLWLRPNIDMERWFLHLLIRCVIHQPN
jgi:hypothetical protein